MMTGILYAAALPLELCGLFAVWNWSIRQRSPGWLFVGGGLLIGLVLALVLTEPRLPSRMYLGFAGMYVFSGLMWAWWVDHLHPADWRLGEVSLAVLAVAMFAIANSAG